MTTAIGERFFIATDTIILLFRIDWWKAVKSEIFMLGRKITNQ
jgi:hypothetical protein